MTTTTLRSIDPKERIFILDSLRGFALLGILLMNIPYFGMPEQVVYNLNIRNEYSGLNYYTFWIVNTLFEGSMRGIFSIMFGASMVLLTSRLSDKSHIDSAAEIYYRRMIWMLLFGLIDAFIILWPGDILYAYAIAGLFLFPFRSMKPIYLFLIASLLFVLLTLIRTYNHNEPIRLKKAAEKVILIDSTKTKWTEDQKEAVEKWTGFKERHKTSNIKKTIEKDNKKVKGDFVTLFWYYASINAMLQSTAYYQDTFLECLIFMLIGIAFYKLKILTAERSKSFYLKLTLIGYLIAFPLVYFDLNTSIAFKFDYLKIAENTPFDIYNLRRFGLTIGHIGLLFSIYKMGLFTFIFKAWAKVGQMAFSNYLFQNIICGLFFHGFAFNKFNELQRYQLYIVVACVWVFNIVFSYVWLKFYRIGPFEWIWRSLTYWEKQPMKRNLSD